MTRFLSFLFKVVVFFSFLGSAFADDVVIPVRTTNVGYSFVGHTRFYGGGVPADLNFLRTIAPQNVFADEMVLRVIRDGEQKRYDAEHQIIPTMIEVRGFTGGYTFADTKLKRLIWDADSDGIADYEAEFDDAGQARILRSITAEKRLMLEIEYIDPIEGDDA